MEERDKLAGTDAGASAGNWRRELSDAVRHVDELWRLLHLPPEALPGARAATRLFPLLVPRGFVALMEPGNLDDPLLRQVVPLGDECREMPGFSANPLAESTCAPGLLHKYQGRALLVTTGACAVHCRYCFRRHFPYDDLPRGPAWWQPALDHLRSDPSVHELLLSGGDPLSLPDTQLGSLARAAAEIPHLTRLRIHTRLPIVLPERVDAEFLAWLTGTRLTPVVVVHANHPRELSPAVANALKRLRDAGIMVLNQSVLLRGINDDVAVLAELSERLAACGVIPYYLHALDRVQGAAHFLVEDDVARRLIQELAMRRRGWLVPRLVREEPGARGKTPLV